MSQDHDDPEGKEEHETNKSYSSHASLVSNPEREEGDRHYQNQTEEEAVAEDEAAYLAEGQTVMIVPTELVPAIRHLIAGGRGA